MPAGQCNERSQVDLAAVGEIDRDSCARAKNAMACGYASE